MKGQTRVFCNLDAVDLAKLERLRARLPVRCSLSAITAAAVRAGADRLEADPRLADVDQPTKERNRS